MTIGELLDAALVLLRTRAGVLLGLGLALSAAEQALLHPLRQLAHMGPSYLPREGHVPQWLLVVATGFGTEAASIAVLGGVAAAAALPALVGRPVARPRRSPAAVTGAVAAVAMVAGLGCGLGAIAVLPWLVVYPLIGLAAPAAVGEGRGAGGALRRSVRLVARSGFRPGMIRILGYLGWLLFRLALYGGTVAALGLVPAGADRWRDLGGVLAWLLVNALAYPVLGCLDAVVHLEARMRTEGLDIALGRALRRGEPVEPALAVP